MSMPLRTATGEPLLHTGITDQLPTDHPHAHTTLYCVRCNAMVHASNNENMGHWIETNTGSYCIDCFIKAYDEYDIDQEQLETKLGLDQHAGYIRVSYVPQIENGIAYTLADL